jgi:phage repressor protein C with HTH and peptisase S24 domain
MNDFSNRFELFIKNQGITPYKLAQIIDASEATISNYRNGKSKPTLDFLSKLLNKYKELNLNWLVNGEGEMLILDNNSNVSIHKLKTDYKIEKQSIPLYEIEASAGLTVFFNNQNTQIPLDYISVPNAPKCDGALFVRGDSMYPLLKAGDIICYKTIMNLENIIYGEMYLLDIDNGDDQFLTIKYVQKSDKGNEYVKLVSENRHHAPKDEPMKNIRALAIIKLSIRYNAIS